MAIDFQRHGAVEVAATFEEWSEILIRAERQGRLGIRSEPLDQRGRDQLAPLASTGAGAMYYPDDAAVDPREAMAALRVACRRQDVDLREDEPVCAIAATGGGAAVTTARGTYSGDLAVLAAGAWSARIPVSAGGRPVPLPKSWPVRGHLLGFALPPGSLRPILRHRHTYLLQRSSGFLVAGTTSEEAGFDRATDPRSVDDIRRRATHLLPCLVGAGSPEVWIGFRPGATQPVAGRAPETSALWLAYGHYRNGILYAPANAARLAAAITSNAETGFPLPCGSR